MVLFRNETLAQRNNSNLSNTPWEPFREPIGPDPSHDTVCNPGRCLTPWFRFPGDSLRTRFR